MKLLRIIEMFLLACIVSMFVFPIGFTFLPESLNTKMILGVMGIAAYLYQSIRIKEARMHPSTIISMIFAMVFSTWCFFSMTANGTSDSTYATYFVSFAVWLGGAYAVCTFIKGLHGHLNLAILVQYLAFVCLMQCILALIIDNYPGFMRLVDATVTQGQQFLHQVGRLYGIGASLDPAGCRFSVVLTLIAHLVCYNERTTHSRLQLVIAIIIFMAVTVVGNMISRTTLVGTIIGLLYIFVMMAISNNSTLSRHRIRFIFILLFIVAFGAIFSIWQYNVNTHFRSHIRFAFEAFFNYFETGEFRTASTDKINNVMWIWPTNVRDWIIGTGWFGFFVYSTDIGYCRFVLYCGIVGFILFIAFFIYNASVVWQKFRNFKIMTIILVALMFILWFKAATDIFWIYALLFCLPDQEQVELK